MRIGYACLLLGVQDTRMKGCLLKNVSEERLTRLISDNIASLKHIIEYNIENGIRLFRISSDIIPFGSSPVNHLRWWEQFRDQFSEIGRKIYDSSMRVSMHPGQYTVLNSLDKEVVDRAIQDLIYHSKVLDCLGTGQEHKIILHIGGVYKNKAQAMERFIKNYSLLPESVKQRLVIENDDKSYTIREVLQIGQSLKIPVVFDTLHHEANPPEDKAPLNYWLEQCRRTWKKEDGLQKIHYSQQHPKKKTGAHAERIGIDAFMDFYQSLDGKDMDIMLEVKDKNLSAVKCMNCTAADSKINVLEVEWSKYKYSVLEKSPSDYLKIRRLLKDKTRYPAVEFYRRIENALEQTEQVGNMINAAQHVWGYFKDKATNQEKKEFLERIQKTQEGEVNLRRIKRLLWNLAQKYGEQSVLNSYYFLLSECDRGRFCVCVTSGT